MLIRIGLFRDLLVGVFKCCLMVLVLSCAAVMSLDSGLQGAVELSLRRPGLWHRYFTIDVNYLVPGVSDVDRT